MAISFELSLWSIFLLVLIEQGLMDEMAAEAFLGSMATSLVYLDIKQGLTPLTLIE